MTTTSAPDTQHLPRISPCRSWCADFQSNPDFRTHPELHQSVTSSVEFPVGDDIHVGLEQTTRGDRPYVTLYHGDVELLTAQPAVMRSLAAQLVAAADVLEGLSGLAGRVR